MQQSMRQHFEISELGQRGSAFAGQLPIAELKRLAGLLCDHCGALEYDLRFSLGNSRLVRVSGEISANLTLQCQRSLEPFRWPLSVHVDTLLVASEEEEKRHQDEGDVRLCPQGVTSLADLIEEEAILMLPLVPIDPAAEMLENPAAAPCPEEEVNPFAALRKLGGV